MNKISKKNDRTRAIYHEDEMYLDARKKKIKQNICKDINIEFPLDKCKQFILINVCVLMISNSKEANREIATKIVIRYVSEDSVAQSVE